MGSLGGRRNTPRGTERLGSRTVSGLAELLPVPAGTAASQHPAEVLELR